MPSAITPLFAEDLTPKSLSHLFAGEILPIVDLVVRSKYRLHCLWLELFGGLQVLPETRKRMGHDLLGGIESPELNLLLNKVL